MWGRRSIARAALYQFGSRVGTNAPSASLLGSCARNRGRLSDVLSNDGPGLGHHSARFLGPRRVRLCRTGTERRWHSSSSLRVNGDSGLDSDSSSKDDVLRVLQQQVQELSSAPERQASAHKSNAGEGPALPGSYIAKKLRQEVEDPSFPWSPFFKTAEMRERAKKALCAFVDSKQAQLVGSRNHVPLNLWRQGLRTLAVEVLKDPERIFAEDEEALDRFRGLYLSAARPSPSDVEWLAQEYVLDLIAEKQDLLALSEAYRELLKSTDLTRLHSWYAEARQMRRKIIYHGGQTNSGKTFRAIERLKQAGDLGGVYLGPLRLLALEVYEKLNQEGVVCDLLTGQEQRKLPFATHTSCTVEMANLNRYYDVAVIDEIQMMGDGYRGSAWTRALLGLRASEIHLCGSTEAVHLVRQMAEDMEDDFEYREYDRRSPLQLLDESLKGNFENVREGDCVVAFSRKKIYAVKREIEEATGHKCCVIYGQLPPETRSQQARLFNEPDNEYKVLVASDAVGMGLNLNIKRIVFYQVEKFDGRSVRPVDPPLMRQIGGRAGRAGGRFPEGEVTCFFEGDMRWMHECFATEVETLPMAGYFPTVDQMQEFAKNFPANMGIRMLLQKFQTLSRLSSLYFICKVDEMKALAAMLSKVSLTLEDRWTFLQCPIKANDEMVMSKWIKFAQAHSREEVVDLRAHVRLPDQAPATENGLQHLEGVYLVIESYAWLAYRFPDTFCYLDEAQEMRAKAALLIQETLSNPLLQKKEIRRAMRYGQKMAGKKRIDRFGRDRRADRSRDKDLFADGIAGLLEDEEKTTPAAGTKAKNKSGPWRLAGNRAKAHGGPSKSTAAAAGGSSPAKKHNKKGKRPHKSAGAKASSQPKRSLFDLLLRRGPGV